MIDREYYNNRLANLKKQKKEAEDNLAYYQIMVKSLDKEIFKLKEHMFKSQNKILQVAGAEEDTQERVANNVNPPRYEKDWSWAMEE